MSSTFRCSKTELIIEAPLAAIVPRLWLQARTLPQKVRFCSSFFKEDLLRRLTLLPIQPINDDNQFRRTADMQRQVPHYCTVHPDLELQGCQAGFSSEICHSRGTPNKLFGIVGRFALHGIDTSCNIDVDFRLVYREYCKLELDRATKHPRGSRQCQFRQAPLLMP